MGCNGCSSGTGSLPAGCNNNGSCSSGGCGKLDTYDWLSNITTFTDGASEGMVEVKFKGTRKGFYLNPGIHDLELGDPVVVEAQNGYDIGHLSLRGELVRLQMRKYRVEEDEARKQHVLRKATANELQRYQDLKEREWRTMLEARHMARQLGLVMKISDVEFQGDGSKCIFYYTADGRVDFRELIKVMARTFHVKIEMRQVGMRQEAGRLGGIGSCGRELCCSTWLTDFESVSINAARYQNLFLNPLKLSGQCGRLKCCLNYELDLYVEALEDFPDENISIYTEKGKARIFKTDILKRLVWLTYEGDNKSYPLTVEKVRELHERSLKREKVEDIESFAVERETAEGELEFINVVGEESINRFDQEKRKKRRRNRKKSSNNRNKK